MSDPSLTAMRTLIALSGLLPLQHVAFYTPWLTCSTPNATLTLPDRRVAPWRGYREGN